MMQKLMSQRGQAQDILNEKYSVVLKANPANRNILKNSIMDSMDMVQIHGELRRQHTGSESERNCRFI